MQHDVTLGRVTLENIDTLKEHEIFVFGSNLAGIHGAGAAMLAYSYFGAVWGSGEGLMGKSYAIPTKDRHIMTRPLCDIEKSVSTFICFAKEHPKLHFLVTQVGCGLAGYSSFDIAPLFKNAPALVNISLPLSFWDVLL